MSQKPRIGIGVVGAGFIAETRARCYRKVSGVDATIVAVCARTRDSAAGYARKLGVAEDRVFTDLEQLLALPDVGLVDLCVPNLLHRPFTEAAARAGKHVVCTKPLTAYVGQDLGDDADDAAISGQNRETMLQVALADADAMLAACAQHGVQLMYGENWVYAPSMHKALRLCAASDGTILDMRGGECHKGSHSPYSKKWRFTGGGALLRLGAHPIGAMLHLKRQEGLRRGGSPIRAVAVTADVSDLSRIPALVDEPHDWVVQGWEDVENWGTVVITFADGSKGVAWGADTALGGMESRIELQLSNCRMRLNLSPNDLLESYTPDGTVFGDEYVMEKIDSGAGWTTPMPDEDWTSGQLAMCQDFVDAVSEGRPALSDGVLGRDVVEVCYAAYVSAAEGRRVELASRA